MLDAIKTLLRISPGTTDFDVEVQDLIDAAKADLALAGVAVDKILDTDALIKRAVGTYCKAYFGYDNPDADRFARSYEMLKTHLALANDYTGYKVTFTVTDGANPVAEAEITIGGVTQETNSLGVAAFVTHTPEVDYDYEITADGYVTVEDSVYVAADVAVGVVLVAT